MQLESLEIQGFKSFPDKTKLQFGGGITAVVGPNGSGKSNIVDAVRWVMGEQSTKTLRGSKMEDVIFGGTQFRGAMGFAQVTLNIDNRDRALDMENDLISITRKLYRSGESEYRLNGNMVRLKDIYELLMDTGLGRDGYSIIGQGKIAEIVSAKNKERREIFEEAAGISKYRYRKGEAERRLEQAQENLLRLKDIMQELEDRVGPLKVQAQKAKEFLEYAGEKKTLEISLWLLGLERSKEQLRSQEDKILMCKGNYDELQNQIGEIEKGIEQAYTNMQALAAAVEEKRAEIKAMEELRSKNESTTAVLENDLLHNRQAMQRLQAEMEDSAGARQSLEQRLEEGSRQVAEQTAKLGEMQVQFGQCLEKLNQSKGKENTVQNEIDRLKERRFGLRQAVSDAKLESAASSTLIDETITRLSSLKDSDEVKEHNIALLKKELEECLGLVDNIEENMASLQNSRQGYELKRQSRIDKLQKLQGEKTAFDEKAKEFSQRAKLLEDLERNMEGYGQSVKFVLSRGNLLPGVHGVVSRIISTDAEYSTAIETALGAAMQNIVVENEDVAKRAIGMLKDSRSGRATFLPLTAVKGHELNESGLDHCYGFVGLASQLVRAGEKYSGIIRSLLGRTVIAEDLDCAVQIARQYSHRFRIVTLDGQVVNAGGSMTGGFTAKNAGILNRQNEIDRLHQQAAQQTAKGEQLNTTLQSVKQELSSIDAMLLGIDGEYKTAAEDKIRYEAEKKRLRLAFEEAVRVKEEAAAEYDGLCARLEELRGKNLTSDQLIQDFASQLQEIETNISALSEKKESCVQNTSQLTEQLNTRRLELLAFEKDLEALKVSVDQLSQQRLLQSGRTDDLSRQMEDITAKDTEIAQKLEQLRQENEEFTQKITLCSDQIQELSQQRSEQEGSTTRLRSEERELTGKREQISGELARLEERRLSLQNDYDGIISRMWDEYEITVSQAKELAQPIEELAKAQRRLSELKSKIKALGSINVDAIEEYKEVSQRYEFMKAQIEDVEKSRDELFRLIGELTAQMKDIFSESFEQINHQFSKIFIELFGGGKAQLKLTDESDILESGIEIFVQPPGKIIKNLAALSGGEQAFVAIAIYFAIMKVRPSPFCLLDEIEAALDDVNVSKYAAYLRRMTTKTQFIAITHRRGTMEEADVLYGVTMQEEGVSKLLELNVSEVESKLGMK